MPEPLIERQEDRGWRNWHLTTGVGGTVERFYTPRNTWLDAPLPPPVRKFEPGLAGLRRIVNEAERDGRRVRAVGSGWSLSAAAFVEDYLVNTAALFHWSLGFSPVMVEAAFQERRPRMVFAQCGVQIKTLNNGLEQNGLALPTAGASNGQTIVGAMSTGTHGSAHEVGAIPDFVLGLHVVGEGGRHFWIERPSRPVMTQAFCDFLGAERIRDEDLFLAAVVGFGSFGLVHAVVFEAAPLYLLELAIKQLDYPQVEHALRTRDVAGLGLPDGDAVPFHFEVVLNPYRLGAGEKGAFVRTFSRRPVQGPLPVLPVAEGQSLRTHDLVAIAGLVSDALPPAIPGLLQHLLETSAAVPTGDRTILGTPGQLFGDSSPTQGGTSTEIGVPLDRLGEALDAIFAVTAQFPFGAPVAVRYLRGSQALLAFTRFSPTTGTIEIPGIDSARSRQGHQQVFAALRDRGIPCTFHWGQALPPGRDWVRAGFGDDRVDRWLAARARFLTPAARRTFSNTLLDACGLSG